MDYMKHLYRLLILLVIAFQARCENSYIFLVPKIVRPGRVLSIEGKLLETPSSPVTVTAKLKDGGTDITSSEAIVRGTDGISLDLSVPTHLKKSNSYQVRIEGTGGLSFSSEKSVTFKEKSSSVFIQTDKSVYKPGQTIHFRVFGVTPELQIIFDKLQVDIHDPKGNKIKIWHVSGAEMTQHGGVFVRHLQLSEFPVMGVWKLKAKLLSYGTIFEEQTFKVEEYVLPKFEAELDLPSYGKTQDATFEGKVKATYTFGKPVKGDVNLRITLKDGRGSAASDVELQFPIDGTASFSVSKSQLSTLASDLDQKTLEFEVNVTEALTRSTQTDKQGVTFYKVPHKVTFLTALPKTFKPGLPYRAVVKVAQRDDTPLEQVSQQLKVTVTQYTWTTQRPWQREWHRPPTRREVPKRLPPTSHTIPSDGFVSLPINTIRRLHKLKIEAEYEGASASLTLKKHHSPSYSYLQLSQISKTSKAGASTTFEIRQTSRTRSVNYQVFSKGKLADTGVVRLRGQKTKWPLMMTSAMAPKSRIIIYYVRGDGEIVADALNVNVEGVFDNKVSVTFNSTDARPADDIRLDVTADAGSQVYLLGVDKSVLLMGSGNDISKTEVIEELESYDTKTTRSRDRCGWFCWHWPLPVGGKDVKDIFEDSGVHVFTDANLYEHKEIIEPPWPLPMWRRRSRGFAFSVRRGRGPSLMMNSAPGRSIAPALDMAPTFDQAKAVEEVPRTPPKDLAPVQRQRKLFPETWLWLDTAIPSSGTTSVHENVPDTITSWFATAFAIHPSTGLGITENPAVLQVSMPFFVSIHLPYSVVRNEKVVIQVNIHNYSPENLYTYVELEKSLEFDNIKMADAPADPATKEIREITVLSESVISVFFPIVPRKLGQIDISIKAQTALMSDAIVKKLLVKPEGAEREYTLPVMVDLKDGGTFTTSVKVDFPKSTVSGSQRVKAAVIGDIMGPSIKGLDKLLKMPYGCGEQNMLKFAPNIFIMKYLTATNNLNEKIKEDATNFMEKGYQRELNYAHSNGAYSAFGERDSSGSTWLTAFVVKSFVQAIPYIFIDEQVIVKAVDWLVEQQNTDGTFREPGRVIHKGMQGGSTGGKISITAYVLISLLEAKSVKGVLPKISQAQQKAQAFLEGEVAGMTDVYDLAIVTYCLSLAGSPQAETAWQKLNAKAITKDGKKHWEKVAQTGPAPKPWTRKAGRSVDIEMTAYALLALALQKNRLEGTMVLKWLTGQRNEDGGFASTQDTVIALQGLAEMAALIHSPTYDLSIDLAGNGFAANFVINNLNAMILQTRDVNSDVGKVTITATGQGMAMVQLEVAYNIISDDQRESFNLKITTTREGIHEFDLQVCTSWLEEGSSSMALLEIGSPSGFQPAMDSLVSEPQHKRVDVDASKATLYFDEIGKTDTCVYVTLRRNAMVAGAQPVPVRVMDYYDPGKSVTEFYIPTSLSQSQVCDVCADCSGCSNPAISPQ